MYGLLVQKMVLELELTDKKIYQKKKSRFGKVVIKYSTNLTFKKNVATITEVNVMQNMYQEKLTHFQSLGSSHLIASPKSLEKSR